ncbi:aspartate aminotransferase family protein [Chitinivibrio alkaliphilus]|uniref:Acetyl ornithine aminotransferase n=1 Tax=Chitinivibrio alkaliphilus ACht1 TaxID=1313304 RepID=U7D959_9BACT|nr:acetylornithine/succinylornithine family transaminase [Chitinivibrio alkaliphilus]ERP31632.1 acetyl ornithine aminotransferase [Chitinivibrio alkaliphilus ACht1]
MQYDSFFVNTYGRGAMPCIERGDGVFLYDTAGTEYLDFISGIAVNALGYNDTELVHAMTEQCQQLVHCSNLFSNPAQDTLARMLVENSFADRVFFCNSGTEANEAAIKFARKKAGMQEGSKTGILSFYDCFHGRTYGAMTATAQKKFHTGFHPIPGGYHYAPLNDIAATEQVLSTADFAAIIVEPVQGEGGLELASPEFLQFLRDYCDSTGTALVFDEIQCGLGRTGSLWAYESCGVTPDILTSAKPLGGGLPLGAVLLKDAWAAPISPGDHGTTFGGNPVACAGGAVVLSRLVAGELLLLVQQRSSYLQKGLEKFVRQKDGVLSYCGKGLLAGVRLNYDPTEVLLAARRRGLLVAKAGKNTLRLIPPLIVTEEHIDRALQILDDIL